MTCYPLSLAGSLRILDCGGRAQRRHRLENADNRYKSGVALRFPPHSKNFGCGTAGQSSTVRLS